MITRKTKSGKEVTIRPPTWGDVQIDLHYINTLSREDTYITFSGEQLTYSQEEKYVKDCIDKISKGDMVKLMCFVDGELAGVCPVSHTTKTLRNHRPDCGSKISRTRDR
jgi:hypothetical protein